MRIILPFKKEVIFDNNISDITSISLEDDLSISDNSVKGSFIVTGDYLVSDATNSVLPFNFELPVNISLDDIYDTSQAECYVDDFYYEIINNKKLGITIDIAVDKLKEQLVDSDKQIDIIDDLEKDEVSKDDDILKIKEDNIKEETNEKTEEKIEENNLENNKKTLFNTDYDDEYKTYLVYIIRENDSVESILEKYELTIDVLKEYNDVSDLKIGDKIIIPSK